ncbi:MAG: hypothetical protein ACXAC5_03450 [Promethearchaeota archaeon]
MYGMGDVIAEQCQDIEKLQKALYAACERLDDGSAWADESEEFQKMCKLSGYTHPATGGVTTEYDDKKKELRIVCPVVNAVDFFQHLASHLNSAQDEVLKHLGSDIWQCVESK